MWVVLSGVGGFDRVRRLQWEAEDVKWDGEEREWLDKVKERE